jgi:hypothetical protein
MSTWSIIEAGITLRSKGPTVPPTPAGPARSPLTRTRVRCAPRPNSDSVFTPGPPVVMKSVKKLLICTAFEATAESCRIWLVSTVPVSKA